MKRIISLWFPYWPSERQARRKHRAAAPADGPSGPLVLAAAGPLVLAAAGPLVLAAAGQGGLRVTAASPQAEAAGVVPGMTLADARALLPGLVAAPADLAGDARALAALADWCIRFTPSVALDGGDGLMLDVSGCAHLYGGEAAMLARIAARLRGLGFTMRAALADTQAAAAAVARFVPAAAAAGGAIVPPGEGRAMLAGLPVAALRLPAETAAALERLGLRRVRDLLALPRAALAARFGDVVGRRLDQALGRAAEVLMVRRPAPPYLARRAFVEPLTDAAGVARAIAGLLAGLARRLEAAGVGARRLELTLFRLDGARRSVAVGTARPTRDAAHLERLLAPHLEALDLGFGVETMVLAATVTEPLAAAQVSLLPEDAPGGVAGDLAALVDRLANRLGPANVVRLVPRASHTPERAVAAVPAMAPPTGRPWRADVARPVRLFPRPEPIEAVAMVPDAPPALFRWRGRAHRVARAEGPERLAAEWWREARFDRDARFDREDWRDYYRVEDTAGARFWLYRQGPYGPSGTARWYLHGLFA